MPWNSNKKWKKNCSMMFSFLIGCLLFSFLSPSRAYSTEVQKIYPVLDEVYPYTQSDILLEKIDLFIDSGIAFTITAMPIYQNTGYPAFLRFCDILKYARANGAEVILRAPAVRKDGVSKQEIKEKLNQSQKAYEENGVPINGISVSAAQAADSRYENLIDPYSYVFLYEDGEEYSQKKLIEFFSDNQSVIAAPKSLTVDTSVSAAKTAYYISASSAKDDIKNTVSNIVHSPAYTDKPDLLGEGLSIYHPAQIPKDYDYQRGVLHNITVNLAKMNRVLMVCVLIAVILFVSMIVHARRANRRRFFYGDSKEDEK